MQAINKGGSTVFAQKLWDLILEKILTTTIRRRLHSMGHRYKTVANKIVLTHNQMMRRVDIVKMDLQ